MDYELAVTRLINHKNIINDINSNKKLEKYSKRVYIATVVIGCILILFSAPGCALLGTKVAAAPKDKVTSNLNPDTYIVDTQIESTNTNNPDLITEATYVSLIVKYNVKNSPQEVTAINTLGSGDYISDTSKCTHLKSSGKNTIALVTEFFDGAYAYEYLCLWAISENCGYNNALCRKSGDTLYTQPNAEKGARAIVCQLSIAHFENITNTSCPNWKYQYINISKFLNDPLSVTIEELMDDHNRWCTSSCNYHNYLKQLAIEIQEYYRNI